MLRDYLPRLPRDKPWSLEEYPTADTSMSLTDHLDLVLALGGPSPATGHDAEILEV